MKKIYLCLLAILFTLGLASCGENGNQGGNEGENEENNTVEAKDFVNRVGTKLDPHNKQIWDIVNKVIFPNKPIIEN